MDEKQILFSPDLAHRLGAIDIGSNSVRLMIAEPQRGGNYRILDEERESTRLGHSLDSGTLDPEAVELTLAALRRFKQIAAGFQVDELRTIATCAVREASDGKEFCRRAKDEADVDVEVISADKEARLAFYSVQRNFDLAGKNVVVADIGGGSTEIILGSGNVIESVFTTPLGAVRLTESYCNTGSAISDEDFERLGKAIDQHLRRLAKKAFFVPHLLIGSGGTFTSLAEMMMAAKGQSGLPVRGYDVTHAELSHLLNRLRKMPVKLRRGVPGLSPDRADIIVAGLAVIDRLMRNFVVNHLQVHNRGVRDGLILTMIDRSLGTASQDPHDREAAIERFAAACSGELAHGKQVARLAGRIFTELAPLYGLNPADQPLLETAARLQDVGYLINYEKHHKHSYHLILNSGLAGFQPSELELIANVARYHRGAKPKKKHANFSQLSSEDQHRVKQLAAILRVAGGLDRSHSGQVQDVQISRRDGKLLLEADAGENPDVDIWGARRRTKMFDKVFKTTLEIAWRGEAAAEGAKAQAG